MQILTYRKQKCSYYSYITLYNMDHLGKGPIFCYLYTPIHG